MLCNYYFDKYLIIILSFIYLFLCVTFSSNFTRACMYKFRNSYFIFFKKYSMYVHLYSLRNFYIYKWSVCISSLKHIGYSKMLGDWQFLIFYLNSHLSRTETYKYKSWLKTLVFTTMRWIKFYSIILHGWRVNCIGSLCVLFCCICNYIHYEWQENVNIVLQDH